MNYNFYYNPEDYEIILNQIISERPKMDHNIKLTDIVVDDVKYRQCTKCGEIKELNLNNFYHDLSKKKKMCIKCVVKNNKKNKLHKNFGITLDGYYAMQPELGCRICKRTGLQLCVDHNHTTGEIRNLLCHSCNLALGYIYENKMTAINMYYYIEKFETNNWEK